jgi:hypothetical protein
VKLQLALQNLKRGKWNWKGEKTVREDGRKDTLVTGQLEIIIAFLRAAVGRGERDEAGWTSWWGDWVSNFDSTPLQILHFKIEIKVISSFYHDSRSYSTTPRWLRLSPGKETAEKGDPDARLNLEANCVSSSSSGCECVPS